MITQCIVWLFLLVSFVRPASYQPSCKPAKDEPNAEVMCTIPTSCKYKGDEDELIATKKDLDCEMESQVKPYSPNHFLIRLKTNKAKASFGFLVDQKMEAWFGCEENTSNKKVWNQIGDKGVFSYETIGKGASAKTICEFDYKVPEGTLFPGSNDIALQAGEKPISGTNLAGFGAFIRCDSDWLKNDFAFDDKSEFVFTKPNARYDKVICDSGDLVYEGENAIVPAASVECKKDGTKHVYKLVPKSAELTLIEADEGTPVNVGCQKKACTMCENLPLPDCQTAGCKQPKKSKEGDCTVLTCDGSRIQLNTDPAVLGTVTCGKYESTDSDGVKELKFRWIYTNTSVEKMSCAEEVKCQTVNKLECPECPETIDLKSDEITCDGFLSVTVNAAEPYTTKSIKCNKQTGVWTAEPKKIPVAAGSKIGCQSSAIGEDGEAQSGTANAGATMYAVYGVVAILIIGISTFLIWYCCVRKKKVAKAAKVKNLDESHKTSTPAVASNHSLQDNLHTATGTKSNTGPASEPMKTAILKQPELVEKTAITPSADEKNVTTALPNTTEEKLTSYDPMMGPRSFIQPDQESMETAVPGKPTPAIPARPSAENAEGPSQKEKDRDSSSLPSSVMSKKTEPPKKVEPEKQPRKFALNAKEEKIRLGATRKAADYPTLADVCSDWEDKPEGAKKKKDKTVGTAVTADKLNSEKKVDQTQTQMTIAQAEAGITTTRKKDGDKSVSGKNTDMVKLITQMDETKDERMRNEKP